MSNLIKTNTAKTTKFDAKAELASKNVQAALEELDTKKTSKDRQLSPQGTDDIGTVSAVTTATKRTLTQKLNDITGFKDGGAIGDGVQNDSTGIQATVAQKRVAVATEGNYKTDQAVTGPCRIVSFGAVFSGINPLDKNFPGFGTGALKTIMVGGENSFIGIAHNDRPANTSVFPTGVTGYGRVDNNGNSAFGVFGRADIYGTGVATNELNSFNYGGAASPNLPPDRSFGTTQRHPISLTVAAGGVFNSSIGIHLAKEGESPQKFLTGIYLNFDSCVNNGVYVAAHPTLGSPTTSGIFENDGNGINLRLQTVGAFQPSNAVLAILDANGVNRLSIKQNGRLSFHGGLKRASVGNAGAASVLPSNPTGYLEIEIDGVLQSLPFYERGA